MCLGTERTAMAVVEFAQAVGLTVSVNRVRQRTEKKFKMLT